MTSASNQRLAAELVALRPTGTTHIFVRKLGRIGLRSEST
jgi:hypothetical protein